MKAPAFDYVRPSDLDGALALRARYGDAAQYLAGGQSLMPSLHFRVASPRLLIDINRIGSLRGIERRGDFVRIGALARHAEVEASEIVRADVPLIAEAVRHVAHPAIRSRGTFGGSLALADPAAELPACAVALGAEIVVAGQGGMRRVAARDFFRGLFETALAPGEIVVEATIPRQEARQRSAFLELSPRRGDFATVGVACQADLEGDKVSALRLVVFGSEPYPRVARRAQAAAEGARLAPELGAPVAEALEGDLEPMANAQGSAAFKRHLAAVLARRAIERMAA